MSTRHLINPGGNGAKPVVVTDDPDNISRGARALEKTEELAHSTAETNLHLSVLSNNTFAEADINDHRRR